MKGLVAKNRIAADTFLCSYTGKKVNTKERMGFLDSLTTEESHRHGSYDFAHPTEEDSTLVPVDESGFISEEFASCQALYVNEASEEGEYPNARFVCNLTNKTLDLVTISAIAPGQEIVAYYGTHYPRSWTLWWFENTLEKDRPKYLGGIMERNEIRIYELIVEGLDNVITVSGRAPRVQPKRRGSGKSQVDDVERPNKR
jgi:hypothetical protein